MFRMRYDAEKRHQPVDRPPICRTWREGSFHTHALVAAMAPSAEPFSTRRRPAHKFISNNVDAQILSAYMEYAFSKRLSVFVDVPYQLLHFGPDIEDNAAIRRRRTDQFPERPGVAGTEIRNPNQDPIGAGDVQVGFKYALIADPNCRYLTFQSGRTSRRATPGWVSAPATIAWSRPVGLPTPDGSGSHSGETHRLDPDRRGPGAGNVVTYGGGIAYDVIRPQLPDHAGGGDRGLDRARRDRGYRWGDSGTPAQVTNSAGTVNGVLAGGVFVPDDHGFLEAKRDTIVNAKIGVRTYFGERSDLYVGYGHALTGAAV